MAEAVDLVYHVQSRAIRGIRIEAGLLEAGHADQEIHRSLIGRLLDDDTVLRR